MEYEFAYMLINEDTREVKTIIVDGEKASNDIRIQYNLPIGSNGYSRDRKYQFSCIVF